LDWLIKEGGAIKRLDRWPNRFIRYFLYTALVGAIMLVGAKYQMQLEHRTQLTGSPNLLLYFNFLFPVLIGILIALPGFISKTRKDGAWKFDWIRCVAIGSPAFVLGVIPLLYYWNMTTYLRWAAFYIQIIISQALPGIVACVTLGFLIVSSFEKGD